MDEQNPPAEAESSEEPRPARPVGTQADPSTADKPAAEPRAATPAVTPGSEPAERLEQDEETDEDE